MDLTNRWHSPHFLLKHGSGVFHIKVTLWLLRHTDRQKDAWRSGILLLSDLMRNMAHWPPPESRSISGDQKQNLREMSMQCMLLYIHTHTNTNSENTKCLPVPLLSPIISHTHIFILAPTHVSTQTQCLQTALCNGAFISALHCGYPCLSSDTPTLIISLSLCSASTHFMVFVDRALSHDKVHADQFLSTLPNRATYTTQYVCVRAFREELKTAQSKGELHERKEWQSKLQFWITSCVNYPAPHPDWHVHSTKWRRWLLCHLAPMTFHHTLRSSSSNLSIDTRSFPQLHALRDLLSKP